MYPTPKFDYSHVKPQHMLRQIVNQEASRSVTSTKLQPPINTVTSIGRAKTEQFLYM